MYITYTQRRKIIFLQQWLLSEPHINGYGMVWTAWMRYNINIYIYIFQYVCIYAALIQRLANLHSCVLGIYRLLLSAKLRLQSKSETEFVSQSLKSKRQNLLATESAKEKEPRLQACILQPIVYSWAWRNINHCCTLTVTQARPT